jgi:hypothetical protein
MTPQERRKNARHDTLHLLDYTVCDQDGKACDQGMGRTLNVSQQGILLETVTPIKTGYTVEISIGFEENMANIKGEVIHSEKAQNERFQAGIEFSEVDDKSAAVLDTYLELFGNQGGAA